MRLYLRGQIWWVAYTVDGTHYRESTGLRTERAAERRARTMVEAREMGRVEREAGIVRRPPLTVRRAVEEWLSSLDADVEAGARSARYIVTLRSHARLYIIPAFGRRQLAEITTADVRRWRDELLEEHDGKRRTSATVNRITAGLRSLCRWALDRDLIERSPTTGLRSLKERPAPRHRALAEHELTAWRSALREARRSADHRQWLDFLIETGLRDAEAAGLTAGMVDAPRRVLRLPAPLCKGARPRDVPLSRRALEILDVRLDGLGRADLVFGPANRRSALERAWQRTGIEGRMPTAHDLRHTAASRWIAAGWSLTDVQHALGHREAVTTSRYLHRYGRSAADLADALDAVAGSPTHDTVKT